MYEKCSKIDLLHFLLFLLLGLEVNPKKTEIINVGLAAERLSRVVDSFNILLPEFKVTVLTKMELHGSTIRNDGKRGHIMKKQSIIG